MFLPSVSILTLFLPSSLLSCTHPLVHSHMLSSFLSSDFSPFTHLASFFSVIFFGAFYTERHFLVRFSSWESWHTPRSLVRIQDIRFANERRAFFTYTCCSALRSVSRWSFTPEKIICTCSSLPLLLLLPFPSLSFLLLLFLLRTPRTPTLCVWRALPSFRSRASEFFSLLKERTSVINVQSKV